MPSATEVTETGPDMSATACVLRGSTMLPPDWFMLADPTTLDIQRCGLCVLSQVYAFEATAFNRHCGYVYASESFGLTLLMEELNGFYSTDPDRYPALTLAWRVEILRLRALAV